MKRLLFVLILFMPFLMYGQHGITTTSLTDKSKKELLALSKDLYNAEVNMSLNINLKDIQSTFEKMSDSEKYDKDHLNELLQKMGNDTLNTIHLNNIANYYSKNNDAELAHQYYAKALENIDLKYFNNDSAFYYSLRGLLKAQLNDTTAVSDFSRSVEINPNDSIAMYFYPLILISNQAYDEARELTKTLFNSHVENPSLPYFYLTLSEVYQSFHHVIDLINKDEDAKKTLVKENYNELINYSLLDEFLMKNKDNVAIENSRLMADLLGLFYKIFLFEQDENNKFVFNYTAYEKDKIREIIKLVNKLKKQKKLNNYTANKSLGYAYYMLEDWGNSIDYFEKAIDVFPIDKKDEHFNSTDCYDAITSICFQQSDTINFRKALIAKMKNEADKENTIDALTQLAFDYYRSDDMENAEKYCLEIRAIDFDNFDALRLLSQLNFVKGAQYLAQFHGESAGRHVRNDYDNYSLIMQFAIYQIYNGDFETANNNIEIAKDIKGEEGCELCDQLLEFIKDNK